MNPSSDHDKCGLYSPDYDFEMHPYSNFDNSGLHSPKFDLEMFPNCDTIYQTLRSDRI